LTLTPHGVPNLSRSTPVSAEPTVTGGLEASSLVELAVRRLRSEILSGALVPGERLVEEQLTRRFGTSRAPLREALRLLGEQGLVEHLPRRGVRVAELSERDIEELFSLRSVLEDMERAAEEGAALEQAAAHRAFHLAVVALAGHHHLLRVYEPVLLQLQLYMATNMRREARDRSPREGVQRHRRLYDAVAGADPAEVIAVLEEHGARTYLSPDYRGAAQ
jgi:DNA-binding GntR family transcriptional regulator